MKEIFAKNCNAVNGKLNKSLTYMYRNVISYNSGKLKNSNKTYYFTEGISNKYGNYVFIRSSFSTCEDEEGKGKEINVF